MFALVPATNLSARRHFSMQEIVDLVSATQRIYDSEASHFETLGAAKDAARYFARLFGFSFRIVSPEQYADYQFDLCLLWGEAKTTRILEDWDDALLENEARAEAAVASRHSSLCDTHLGYDYTADSYVFCGLLEGHDGPCARP